MKMEREEKIDFKKILHNAKLKNTTPRLAVLEALSKVKHPETTQEIHQRLKNIDLVTLYRTLASFEESGLLRKVDLCKDAVYYEINTNHHHHIICTECNNIEDFENREVEKVLEKIAKKSATFANIKSHSLELFGLCKTCA